MQPPASANRMLCQVRNLGGLVASQRHQGGTKKMKAEMRLGHEEKEMFSELPVSDAVTGVLGGDTLI